MDKYIMQAFANVMAKYATALGPPVILTDAEYAEKQKHELNKNNSEPFRFSMFVEISPLRLVALSGFQKALDQPLDTFGAANFMDFIELIHPDYREAYLNWGSLAYKLANEERKNVVPFRDWHRTCVPLRYGETDTYYWCDQAGTAARIDKDGNMVAHLNVYERKELLRPENVNRMSPFSSGKNASETEWDKRLWAMMRPVLKEDRYRVFEKEQKEKLTARRYQILCLYAQGHTREKVCELLGIKADTLREHNGGILKAIFRIMAHQHKSAPEAAKYLKEKGIIDCPTTGGLI